MKKRGCESRSPEMKVPAEGEAITMKKEENVSSPPVPDETVRQEYLTFRLAEEDYGVDILRVQEIRGWEPVARIPNAPEFVKGVLNLRGSIVPVIDMRCRLGMPLTEYGKETVVIVVKVIDSVRERIMGVVVDTVSDVVAVAAVNVRDAPQLATDIPAECFSGAADADGRMIMLLDVDRLMCKDDVHDPGGENVA
jgi:purine-binding chemotaxis protein CheW